MTTPTHQGAAPTHQGATPTHQVAAAMQQPWEEMAEPMRADTPSGDQTVGDPMKRPVNIGKLSSAIKQVIYPGSNTAEQSQMNWQYCIICVSSMDIMFPEVLKINCPKNLAALFVPANIYNE